jgi:trimethylamine-N-oxide reductase (cytochrome c)
MTQRPGGSDLYSQAYQSPNLEFICFQAMEWVGGTQYADIVLPVSYVQENEDIIAWHNYVVYNAPAIPNMYESKSDMQIVYDLANMLGVMSKLSPGRSGDYQTDLQYWLANGFANIAPAVSTAVNAQPTTYAAFKQVGYVQFPTPDYALTPQGGLAAFNLNPTTSPINTPSGLIEIYSQQVAAFWGTSDPVATPVPHYIPSPENRLAAPATSGQYPLEFMTIHSFFSEHEQWHHMSWARDDPITFQNGYQTLWVNPVDAAARGINNGDTVKLSNARGQTLYGAYVTQRCKPGLVIGMDGGNWKPITPGKAGSLNMGAAANLLTPQVQADVTCDGMATSGLVQMVKWDGTGS